MSEPCSFGVARVTNTTLRCCGFSLVELLVTIVILALLILAAAPAMSNYVSNGQIRSTAESLQAAIALARNEAMKRNQPVSFVLDAAAQEWRVQTVNLGPPVTTEIIRQRPATEAAGLLFAPNNVVATFDALGRSTTGAIGITVSKPSAGTCETAGGRLRCLNVNLLAGGPSRMCDPMFLYAQNPKGC